MKKVTKMKTMEVSGIVCPKCEEFVWSRHRHDFRYCGCGYCAADGGRDYLKVSYGGLDGDFPEPWTPPEVVSREVTLSKEDQQRVKYEPRWPY